MKIMRHLAATTGGHDRGQAEQVFSVTVLPANWYSLLLRMFIHFQKNPNRQELKPLNVPIVKPEPKEEPEGSFITVNAALPNKRL